MTKPEVLKIIIVNGESYCWDDGKGVTVRNEWGGVMDTLARVLIGSVLLSALVGCQSNNDAVQERYDKLAEVEAVRRAEIAKLTEALVESEDYIRTLEQTVETQEELAKHKAIELEMQELEKRIE